ncbi:MAG TPA: hypothetical protein VF158_02560 [Longimicrobiales bacterium]
MLSVRCTRLAHAGARALHVASRPALLVLAMAAAPAAGATAARGSAIVPCAEPGALLRGPDPYAIRLVPTAHANGASGTVRLAFSASPFGVSVTRDGHHAYDAVLTVADLPATGGAALVAWVATPALDRVHKLGALDRDGRVEGRIRFNKFLIFVTAEPSADVDRWSGPILLRGISPSGRMHSLAGHGPFAGEPCGTWNTF